MAQNGPDSFYIHFNSELCDRSNKWEYIIHLPEYINCGPKYEIGLVHCSYAHDKDQRYFCINLIEAQYVHTRKIRILKVIPPSTRNYRNLFTPTYVQMNGQSSSFNSFKIYILSHVLERVSLKTELIGTLHVRKIHHD